MFVKLVSTKSAQPAGLPAKSLACQRADREAVYPDMPQKQHVIPLVPFKREPGQAIATGNNAAWICICRRALPLLGCSGDPKGPTEKTRVDCPDCGRAYFVVPNGHAQTAALEVREV